MHDNGGYTWQWRVQLFNSFGLQMPEIWPLGVKQSLTLSLIQPRIILLKCYECFFAEFNIPWYCLYFRIWLVTMATVAPLGIHGVIRTPCKNMSTWLYLIPITLAFTMGAIFDICKFWNTRLHHSDYFYDVVSWCL